MMMMMMMVMVMMMMTMVMTVMMSFLRYVYIHQPIMISQLNPLWFILFNKKYFVLNLNTTRHTPSSLTGGSGSSVDDATSSRDYVNSKMCDEIHEIVRVLQLTTYDEEEWDADDATVMKKAQVHLCCCLLVCHYYIIIYISSKDCERHLPCTLGFEFFSFSFQCGLTWL